MTDDFQNLPPSPVDSPVGQESTGFAAPKPADMRFASDHGTLAPHQLPELPSEQSSSDTPSITLPKLSQQNPETAQSTQKSSASVSAQPGQQITLTITTGTNSSSSQALPSARAFTRANGLVPTQKQSGVEITVQPPVAKSPKADDFTTNPADSPKPDYRVSKSAVITKWVAIVALTCLGMKGFFDSLYFILVEFQTFQKDVESHLIETSDVNPLILKASLLVFATALSVFFGMQLIMTSPKKLHWIKIIASIAVGIICTAVLQYANTINVLSTFKSL